MLEP
ncbi:hypothetical protein BLA29_015422, partial [Euroglyphus maynei]|jgi:hypothetical protein